MTDPIGLIGAGGAGQIPPAQQAQQARQDAGASFHDLLAKNIEEVNKLQQDAVKAVDDLATGKRSDIEGVLLATAKADTALKAVQAVRNKMVEAYQEVSRMPI